MPSWDLWVVIKVSRRSGRPIPSRLDPSPVLYTSEKQALQRIEEAERIFCLDNEMMVALPATLKTRRRKAK